MRPSFLVFFFFLSFALYSQENQRLLNVHLSDGSLLKARLVQPGENGRTIVTLSDGTLLSFETQQIVEVSEFRPEVRILPNGRKITERGAYSTLNFHMMSGKTTNDFGEEGNRWGYGFHWSRGYRFLPALGMGAGLGIDANEFYFLPVFVEMKGYILNKDKPRKEKTGADKISKDTAYVRWFNGYFDSNEVEGAPKQKGAPNNKALFTYNLQFGYSFALEDVLDNSWEVDAAGGYMFYPSVGLLFPSKSAVSFRMDLGYKFQSYERVFNLGGPNTIDSINLRSFAVRMGWEF